MVLRVGHAAWPQVIVDEASVARQVTEDSVVESHAADLYLAGACASGNPAALTAFERQYMSQIGSFVARVSTDSTFVDDVRQALRQKLFVGDAAKINDYAGRGPLTSWLRIVALRTALNLARDREPYDGDDSEKPSPAADPELAFIHAQYRDEFNRAFADALALLDSEQRGLLKLHYIDGMTLDQAAAFYQTSRATLARRMARVRDEVCDKTRQLLAERLSLSTRDLNSIIRVAQSNLEASVRRFLT
jgi:RNA polymerase sigma-70 factor (ECF subfamily)